MIFMKSFIDKIEFFVPSNKLSNKMFAEVNPSWDVEKIYEKLNQK